MATILSSRIHSNDVVASHSALLPLEEHLACFPEHVREPTIHDGALEGPRLLILVVHEQPLFPGDAKLRLRTSLDGDRHSRYRRLLCFGCATLHANEQCHSVPHDRRNPGRNWSILLLVHRYQVWRHLDPSHPSRIRSPAPHGQTTSAEPASSGVTRPYVPHRRTNTCSGISDMIRRRLIGTLRCFRFGLAQSQRDRHLHFIHLHLHRVAASLV
jgi:hypothetical protein